MKIKFLFQLLLSNIGLNNSLDNFNFFYYRALSKVEELL